MKTDSTHLLIDFGMPIVTDTGKEFDNSILKNTSLDELIKQSVLPDIDGLYKDESKINGILLSHSHLDHYGLMDYVNNDIPVYLGEATGKIIEINNIFQKQTIYIHNPIYFQREVQFTIGDIAITPYWNDHSAFDAYSFLIEAEGKRIFYSGDFRGHGRKEGAYRWFLKNAPKDIDYLILEGTSVGKNNLISEYGVEKQMKMIFEHSDNGCYVWTSSQNIDRLVSIYKACSSANKTLVLDIYTANVLNILSEYGMLPTPLKGYTNLKVFFNQLTTTKLLRLKKTAMVYPFTKYKTTSSELNTSPGQFVVLIRPTLLPEIKKIAWKDGIVVYSMWEGYKTKPYSAKFLEYFSDNNFKIINLHSSGHADEATLIEYADALNPKNIIPIHTFHKNQYQSIFSQAVLVLEDNQQLSM